MFVLGEDVPGLGFGMGFVRDDVSRVGCNF